MTLLEGRLIGEDDWIGIEELCRLCDLSLDMMTELLELEIVQARGGAVSREWQVPAADLPRLRVAGRLIHDLGVNVSGAALAVELLEAQRRLERRVRELERLFHEREFDY
jgi:chaperone modulatory protein CbpM